MILVTRILRVKRKISVVFRLCSYIMRHTVTVILRLINILYDQFASVFTTNSVSNCVVNLDGQPYPALPPIQVDVEGVINLLHNQPHKATGLDGIPPTLLRDTAISIAPIRTCYVY